MEKVKVEGRRKDKKVFLYALSTCGWCKKTKDYLQENDVEYEYIDVDKCTREEQKEIVQGLKEKNIPVAFPVIMIGENEVISGFKQRDLSEALGL